MRALPLILLLAAAPVRAQDAPVSHDPTARQHAALVAGGVIGSVVLVSAVSPLAAWPPGVALTLAAIPVGTAAGVRLAGRLVGVEGTTGAAFRGAAVGTLVGLGSAVVVVFAGDAVVDGLGLRPASYEWFSTADVVLMSLAAGLAIGTPAAFSARRFSVEAAPVLLSVPEGSPGAGLTLRVSF